MKNFLLSFFGVVSAAIFVATSFIWVRSWQQADVYVLQHHSGGKAYLRTASGCLHVRVERNYPPPWSPRHGIESTHGIKDHWFPPKIALDQHTVWERGRFGFGYTAGEPSPSPQQWEKRDLMRREATEQMNLLEKKHPKTNEEWKQLTILHRQSFDLALALPGYKWEVLFPVWVLLLPSAVVPLVWTRRWRALCRRAQGSLCNICGYDLRSSPLRCPECGTAIVASAQPVSRETP